MFLLPAARSHEVTLSIASAEERGGSGLPTSVFKKRGEKGEQLDVFPCVAPHSTGEGALARAAVSPLGEGRVITVQSFGTGLLLFDLVVFGEQTKVVFDTAGECSLVCSSFLQGRKLEVRDSDLKVRWGGVTDIGQRGDVDIPLEFGPVKVKHSFLVADSWNLPGKLLLGCDFIRTHQVVFVNHPPQPIQLSIEGQQVDVVWSPEAGSIATEACGCRGPPTTSPGRPTPTTPGASVPGEVAGADQRVLINEEEDTGYSGVATLRESQILEAHSCGVLELELGGDGEVPGRIGSMLFIPREFAGLRLSEGVVGIRRSGNSLWFRVPYAVEEDFPVEVESTVCIGDVVELQKRQLDEDIVAIGAVKASISTTDSKVVRLLEEVDSWFARGSKEHDMLSGLVREGVVGIRRSGNSLWFRVPYAVEEDFPVEVESTVCIGDVVELQKRQLDEDIVAIGAVKASISTTDSKVVRLLEEVDSWFARGSKEHDMLSGLVREFPRVFSLDDEPLEISDQFFHEIRAEGPPIYKKSYPIPLKYREEIRRQIEDMMSQGVISPSWSPYNSPLVPVRKKDGSLRLCLDFRLLNEVIQDDSYPLPHIVTVLQL
ncbi:uncharacterized protein LOC125034761 isoform X3 [Penaeus chinensis]|uniref:uncharacterized protein LOC125034761 isoform X3 n=1 Tax=Penaeus chinensis TaxID=139456 RepID=UPI001FB6B016|nr:uncharacterized protein LOC125034761 isoform X3 [Penaeus chinensis]